MKKLILTTLLSAGLFVTQADAGHRGNGHHKHHKDYDYARVVHVEPIYQRVERSIPRESCWTERVAYEQPHRYRNDSYTDELIGGLIGGAIGNAVGHNKTNKKVQAVIGAAIGASIAHDINRPRGGGYNVSYRDEQRCAVTHDVEYHEQVSGYHVTYRYHGQEYQTRTHRHPGKRIKVRVDVTPVH